MPLPASKVGVDSAAEAGRVPMTLDILLETRSPSDVAISTDGKRVAFVVWERLPGEQKRRGRIWVADTEKGESLPFTPGKRDETCPRWSPDGKQLAFMTQAEGEKEKPQVYLMPSEGGEARQMCTMPNGVSNLSWAPDGSRIAFLSLEGEEPQSDPKVITSERHKRLWTVRPDSVVPEPVTPNNFTIWEYIWSPDSRKIALHYAPGPDKTDWYRTQIGVVAAEGGAIRQVTHLSWQPRALAWSPDSQQLAYVCGRWSDPGRGAGDVWSVSVESGETRNLTPGIDSSPTWCSWLPDGRHLLFATVKDVTHQICLLDSADGSITLLADDFVMFWDMPTPVVTPDGRHCATVHSNSQQPYDVWYGQFIWENEKPTDMQWRRLSRLNPIVEETVAIAWTERIHYESVDGWRVDGLFMLPSQSKDGELPPLYVDVHGGPSGAECDYWAPVNQYLAAQGFAVFRPNMRGSWGHGMEFADAVIGDMGGKDLQDILNGVEYLVRRGLVDGNRVGIGGWSNGGFLSAWAVTQTNRFKAAMMGAGISDWHNMHAQTTLADADVLLLAADPLEKPEVYRQRSPITYAARVTTPTLILHGENDSAVPVAQAYAFHRALREHNISTELVVYPREGHGLSEAAHVRDAFGRLAEWLKRYVKCV